MAKRDLNKETRGLTVNEIIQQDQIIRRGFEAEIGVPLGMPLKKRPEKKKLSEQGLYMEERIARTVGKFRGQTVFPAILNQKDRDQWWKEYEYSEYNFSKNDPQPDDEEQFKWNAYCILIGIPPGGRVTSMFQMLDTGFESKDWPIEVVASVTTGKLLGIDLATYMEFFIWFSGGFPDTFAGELDKDKAHRLIERATVKAIKEQWLGAPLPSAAEHITPANAHITVPAMLSIYRAKSVINLKQVGLIDLLNYLK